ncbi:hypothetical protein, partial [Comamonas thiooxydans]|uniref:hypothetical protein n=1 Tax=Comamonas thiooxydans TaxID=363952 RepID=UPI0013F48CF8
GPHFHSGGTAMREHVTSNAAASRHYGEEVLINETLKAISNIQINDKYQSIEDFFKEHKKIFDQVLREYQDRLGSPIVKGGPALDFGEALVTDDFPKYLKKWSEDEKIRIILNFYLKSKITN